MTGNKEVVLVTGGSGFVGQHVVKLLNLKTDWVKEIRVFDIKPFKKNLDYEEKKPCVCIVGDLTNVSDVNRAIQGVDTVIHVASIVDITMFPDVQLLTKINVEGTRNIIDACLACDVDKLVYTGSANVMLSQGHISLGDESYPVPDQSKMTGMKAYCNSKIQAEILVNQAHGASTVNGKTLKTVTLRPQNVYGEGDTIGAIPTTMKSASTHTLWMPTAKQQYMYAGNVAWAHIVAAKTLALTPEVGGQSYFVTDDTPLKTVREFSEPFLQRLGYKYTSFSLPVWILYIFWIIKFLLLGVRVMFKQFNFPYGTDTIHVAQIENTFTGERLRKVLKYKPMYSVNQAFENSVKYYSRIS